MSKIKVKAPKFQKGHNVADAEGRYRSRRFGQVKAIHPSPEELAAYKEDLAAFDMSPGLFDYQKPADPEPTIAEVKWENGPTQLVPFDQLVARWTTQSKAKKAPKVRQAVA